MLNIRFTILLGFRVLGFFDFWVYSTQLTVWLIKPFPVPHLLCTNNKTYEFPNKKNILHPKNEVQVALKNSEVCCPAALLRYMYCFWHVVYYSALFRNTNTLYRESIRGINNFSICKIALLLKIFLTPPEMGSRLTAKNSF